MVFPLGNPALLSLLTLLCLPLLFGDQGYFVACLTTWQRAPSPGFGGVWWCTTLWCVWWSRLWWPSSCSSVWQALTPCDGDTHLPGACADGFYGPSSSSNALSLDRNISAESAMAGSSVTLGALIGAGAAPSACLDALLCLGVFYRARRSIIVSFYIATTAC